MVIYCGIDWGEHQHDVAVVDARGELVAKRRIGDEIAGFTELCELLYRLRRLARKLVGQLHLCLQRHQPYREDRAWTTGTHLAA